MRNLPYYKLIRCSSNDLYDKDFSISKFLPNKNDFKQIKKKSILTKIYNYKKHLYSCEYFENKMIKKIFIENNKIYKVCYYMINFDYMCSNYKYVYNDNYIYSYRGLVDYYQSKFSATYRLAKLFI